MDGNLVPPIAEGRITAIQFSLATQDEICTSSISDCPISHTSQLANPFLGLPLESGKCESCGTAEPGKCDGHFGYIQLPVPVYHPCHMCELKKLLNLICLKCLRMKKGKIRHNGGTEKSSNAPCSYCPDIPQITVNEASTSDGAVFLELKIPARSPLLDGFWNFLDRYGYQYGEERKRPLLPCEVLEMLNKIPLVTRKTLSGKGYFSQDGYILQKLPVPPNCLSVPDISDGTSIMSSDISISMLKKVLRQAEIIKGSRSGSPNFESHRVEANDLQLVVAQYLNARGIAKAPHGINSRFGINKEAENSSTKAWLEKMKALFISKGSGFSSRTVITGDAYKKVNEIGLPVEIAQMVTFEEKVTEHNKDRLQELVDNKLCLTYRDGGSMYSLREGSKGYTSLRVGQVVHRRVMDGDMVFINRQPSTHKHSLQALSVYVHDDHTVKINPLICAPLGADFDGDCLHLFYPQSLAAKAEVLELFSVEHQLLSSHSGSLNLQFANDALLSVKAMFNIFFLDKPTAQQLAMFVSTQLPEPALWSAKSAGYQWTVLQILQTALPAQCDCYGQRFLISKSEMLKIDFNRDAIQSLLNEIVTSVFFEKGSKAALNVFNSLQPLLMENIFLEGYSVSLKDFYVPMAVLQDVQQKLQEVSPQLHQLRSTYVELVALGIEDHLKNVKLPLANFIRKCSGLGSLIDLRSESSIDKVVQQIGFLGLQLRLQLDVKDNGYSRTLVEDINSFVLKNYAFNGVAYPTEAFGLIKSCFFHGLNPCDELLHSVSSREVLIRSSRGLTEPGTLFKNLMAILRDVVVCYDGTVRNVCTNSVVQFEYGVEAGTGLQNLFPAGEPVGVLAATAVTNHAYKAVLDSSPGGNSSWDLMKEILLCGFHFKNDLIDRRVILFLNDCGCRRKYCKENAACLVRNQLKRVSLKDIALEFLIEYHEQQSSSESSVSNASLVGHIHLDEKLLKYMDQSMHEVLLKCQETIGLLRKKKKSKLAEHLKRIVLTVSECCCFQHSKDTEWSQSPCLRFSSIDTSGELEITAPFMANIICPILLDTIIKGDRRVETANIIWISPETSTWVKNHRMTQNGEVALEIVLEKGVVKQTGDAWRIVLDSCLPVMQSIDTRRSIPYAIKQVQQLLGISCAFDQAVQRLSKSIGKIGKGVLKEHCTLVANSMTCTGNLIGFSRVGYKAFFQSLNVQVPFTQATLFMPRKCFERAAEKCHKDSLSSIVASCSWGKQVAVGTGTRFEILWNKKEIGSNQDGVIDVYNFLQLVRMSSNGKRSDTACLGEEIDDLELEEGDMELAFSPEHNSDSSKPIFDDQPMFQSNFEQQQPMATEKSSESNWETNSSLVHSGGSNGWGIEKPGISKPDAWSGWGTEKKEMQVGHSTKLSEEGTALAWNTTESQKQPSSAWGKRVEESDTSRRDKNDEKAQWGQQKESHASLAPKLSEELSFAGWNSSELQEPAGAWDKKAAGLESTPWNKNAEKANGNQWKKSNASPFKSSFESPNSGGWNTTAERVNRSSGNSSSAGDWTKNDFHSREEQQKELPSKSTIWDTNTSKEQAGITESSQAWGSTPGGQSKQEVQVQWGQQQTESKSHAWGGNGGEKQANKPESSQAWGSTRGGYHKEKSVEGQWGQQKDQSKVWGKNDGILGEKPESSAAWGSTPGGDHTAREVQGQWGQQQDQSQAWGKSDGSHGEQGTKPESSQAWGSTSGGNQSVKEVHGQSGQQDQSKGWEKSDGSQSEQGTKPETSQAWGSTPGGDESVKEVQGQWGQQQDQSKSRVWGEYNGNQSEKEVQVQWGQQKDARKSNTWGDQGKRQSGRGWGASNFGDRKFMNNRPAKSPGQGKPEDWNTSGVLTINRQRFDSFTSEEQPILSDVEQIMRSIRRIMQQYRNDGDPLSPEDQSYVVENVLNYHPDKEKKMGPGFDYVMVSQHSNFQDTRCFYIVSTDGRKEDFSYRKCVDNFIKEKYPEMATSFMAKYFKKSQAQPQTPTRQTPQPQTPTWQTPQPQTPMRQTQWPSQTPPNPTQ